MEKTNPFSECIYHICIVCITLKKRSILWNLKQYSEVQTYRVSINQSFIYLLSCFQHWIFHPNHNFFDDLHRIKALFGYYVFNAFYRMIHAQHFNINGMVTLIGYFSLMSIYNYCLLCQM